jgi:hypothetical protein
MSTIDGTMPTTRSQKVVYWVTTGAAALVLGAIGVADLVREPAVMDRLAHLGYPAYLATLLGAWLLLGAATIVAPGLPRVKEWAYAGMVFALTGAAISHGVSGDSLLDVLVPLVLVGLVVVSWLLQGVRGASVSRRRRQVILTWS